MFNTADNIKFIHRDKELYMAFEEQKRYGRVHLSMTAFPSA